MSVFPPAAPNGNLQGMTDNSSIPAREPVQPKDATVLIVEDYEPLRVLLSDILSMEGSVDTAANGEQGLAKLAEQHYDIILSDDYMPPSMSGVEFCQQVREARLATPIIISGSRSIERVRSLVLVQLDPWSFEMKSRLPPR